jgi:hypothetical protein
MIPRSRKSGVKTDDLLMYLAIGRKHLRLIVLLICFSMLLGLTFYTFSKPVYYAKSDIRYQTLERSAETDRIFQYTSDKSVLMQLSSPHIMERTARKLGIVANSKEITQKYLKRAPLIKFDSENNIDIEVWAFSYPLARDWAETLVKEYLLYRDEKRIEHSEAVIKSFTKEMAQMKEKMDDILTTKLTFNETNEMTKLIIDLNQLKQVPQEIAITKHRLAMMEQARETLRDKSLDTIARLSLLSALDPDAKLSIGQVVPGQNENGANGDPSKNLVVTPLIAASNTKPWEELDMEQRRLEMSLRDVGQAYLPGHPKIAALKKQLDSVTNRLELELEAATNRFNVEYANMTEQLRQLEAKLPAYEEVKARHEKMLQDYTQFDSGQLAWKNLYADMARRISAWDFAADKERAQLQYMGHAEIKDEPVSPNPSRILLAALALAVALSVAVPSLIEFLDSCVTDIDQVEQTLHIRGMGIVPKITEAHLDKMQLLNLTTKSDHHLKENFRIIRTNLILNSDKTGVPQVIMVTSALPQEGKTMISSNLALSFAH